MFKLMKVVAVVMLMVMVIAMSGCQSSKAVFEDIAGSATWCADRLTASAEQAAERDADLAAKRLAKRQAILKAHIDLERGQ
jgi:hypothetical protein